jgi:predicted N-acetyltransferase YhbS
MKRAFEIAKNMGYTAIFLCGAPEFYRKIGFVPTYERNIYHINDKERSAEWCMVRELVDRALTDVSGIINIQ